MGNSLDAMQVLKEVYDPATSRLKVSADAELTISHTNDSIAIGDGVDTLAVNTDGSTNNRIVNQLVTVPFDAITVEQTSSTVETYQYRTGGAGGTIVATVTVTYTDVTKETLSSVVRT